MEKKLNNGDDSTKRKSIDDHERRRHAEKSRAAEQQKRTRVMDGPRLFRDVMIKLGLQRQPVEREHINTKIFEASRSLERLTSPEQDAYYDAMHEREEHEREALRDLNAFPQEHQLEAGAWNVYYDYENAGYSGKEVPPGAYEDPDLLQAYENGVRHFNNVAEYSLETGQNGFEMPRITKTDPAFLNSYIQGLENHKIDLHMKGTEVPPSTFERINQLISNAKAISDKLPKPSLERQGKQIKSEGPELGQ